MQIKLKVLTGKAAGQVIAVPGDEFLIGRDADCQLRPKSDAVASKHCRLRKRDGALLVADLGSPTGTMVNGRRIEAEQELKSGDQLVVGPLQFEVLVDYDLGGKREKVRDIRDVAARTAQRSKQRDLDVSELLKEEPAEAPRARYFSLDEIEAVEPEAADEERPAEGDSSDKKKAESQPGKLPPTPPVPQSKDTSEAAADMLRKLFGKK